MNRVDGTLLILAMTVVAGILARRQSTIPFSVVLAIAGIAVGFVWRWIQGFPALSLPPGHVLLIFLPPLLTTAAYALPVGAFRRNIGPIATLAVGLVLLTIGVVAIVAHTMLGLSWPVALALGAIVSPPDPVAATTVANQTGLRHRIVVILEGEGLVNDAVAIIVYGLAVRAAVDGQFAWTDVGRAVLWNVPVGILIGLGVGMGAMAPLRRHLDDVTIEAGVSLLMPYVTYEIADRLGASAVLAVVTLGFVLQRQETSIAAPAVRVAIRTVWGAVRFASTALVFFLLGLFIGQDVGGGIPANTVRVGIVVTVSAIGLRLAWMHSVPYLRFGGALGASLGSRRATLSRHEATVAGWAGMRGVVSLALALALPSMATFDGGVNHDARYHDARYAVIAITFIVIVGTLIVQGATLQPLVRWLGVADPEREARDERRVRARARRAGMAMLERVARENPALAEHCASLTTRISTGTIGIAADDASGETPSDAQPLLQALDAQYGVITAMRDAAMIGETLAERLVTEIDVDKTRIAGDINRLTGAAD